MDRFEVFEEALRSALPQLHAASFEPPEVLYQVTGCDPAQGPGPVQSRISAAIEGLDPGPGVPPASRAGQEYKALQMRFVLGLTQKETAQHLHMSVRSVQRIQMESVHVLARRLWAERSRPQEVAEPGDQASDWRSQAALELASLRQGAPNARTDVAETIRGLMALANVLTARYGVGVEVKFVQPNLVAAIHPAALRQTLITAIGRIAPHIARGKLSIYATHEDGQVEITITGHTTAGGSLAGEELLSDVIVPPGASIEVQQKGERVFLWVRAPSLGERRVLVVEDNPDMVHFYRRCTAGTPYRVDHLMPGHDAIDVIEAAAPDVIVLDVMLPEVDGWQLLTHLHERTATRSIPVVVCSVVKEEALALALGAARFLSKPVQPQQLVEALGQALLLD